MTQQFHLGTQENWDQKSKKKKKKKDLFKNKTPSLLHQKVEIIQIFINKRMDKT